MNEEIEEMLRRIISRRTARGYLTLADIETLSEEQRAQMFEYAANPDKVFPQDDNKKSV